MTNEKQKNKQEKVNSCSCVCFFFCLFLHFIIKNKSVFLYFTIHFAFPNEEASIFSPSLTKKGNSNLVVSLVFKGYLKSRGGCWVVDRAIGPLDNWDGEVGREHRTFLGGRESAEDGLSLGVSFFLLFL